MKSLKIIFLLPILFFIACSDKQANLEKITKANLKKVSWSEINGFENNNFDKSYEAFKLACTKDYRFEHLKLACENIDYYENSKDFFTKNFIPFKLYDDNFNDKGLITGYYEPLLNGSRTKTDKYKYPIYKVPDDLIVVDLSSIYPELDSYRLRGRLVDNKVVPYYDRENLKDSDELEAICYVDSRVDRFFMEIQGSGKVRLRSGEIINIGYANQNGRKYYSIGKKLLKMGVIKKEDMSLQAIKKWLITNPKRVDEVLNLNKSVVFFQENKKGATGALGVPLIAKRNLAVDREYIPLGLPVFVNTTNPITKEEINQLMVAADVGGAIKGEIRADFFWGNSKIAERLAGKMKQKGEMFLLVPKVIID